jgi:hypothetical protein
MVRQKDSAKENTVSAPQAETHPLVDLTDPNNVVFQRQNSQRDRLAKFGDVYLVCTDGFPSDCAQTHRDFIKSQQITKLHQISSDLIEVMRGGDRHTKLKTDLVDKLELVSFLSGDKQTSEPPMGLERSLYWELVTRPYEQQLVKALSSSSGEIKQNEMMQTALKITDNDLPLAILILANFTKNMASIERRQIWPENIDPSLRATYTKQIIDPIFHRIEGLADSPTDLYNKEGALYHFYGAMFAGYLWGRSANVMVWEDNSSLKDTADDDSVKDAAGIAGAHLGLEFSRHEYVLLTVPEIAASSVLAFVQHPSSGEY